jgi:hypothetical protein
MPPYHNSNDIEPLIDVQKSEIARKYRWRINKNPRSNRMRLLVILSAICYTLIYLFDLNPYQHTIVRISERQWRQNLTVPHGYLVYSPQCKMLSFDPFASDVMKLCVKEEFEPCNKKHPLTSVEQNFEKDTVKLIFHREFSSEYLNEDQNDINCCFREIGRGVTNSDEAYDADERFKLGH